MPRGIDVSEFNGDIDIKSLKPEFVIIRAGDGNYWDSQLENNINKCISDGIPYGLYWLIRDWTEESASVTADALCRFANIQKVKPTVGIWCDVEDEYDSDPEDAIPYVDAFCKTVEKLGYYSGIYCNSYYYGYLYPDLGAYDCWLACWDEDPNDDPGVGTMKQYSTSKGHLDLDVSFIPLEIYDLKKNETPPQLTIEDRLRLVEDKLNKIERMLNKNEN